MRTERARRDPIHFAVPLDEPLGEDTDAILSDIIPDPDVDVEGECAALDCRAAVTAALSQIEEMQYDTRLLERGIKLENIRHYGFAFEEKTVL